MTFTIPAKIFGDNRLSSTEKMVYGLHYSCPNISMYHFSKMLHCPVANIYMAMKELRALGLFDKANKPLVA